MRPWDNNTVVFELEIVVQLLLFHDNNIEIGPARRPEGSFHYFDRICNCIRSIINIRTKVEILYPNFTLKHLKNVEHLQIALTKEKWNKIVQNVPQEDILCNHIL